MFGVVWKTLAGLIVGSPVIVYGGIKEYPQRARKTEDFLVGKNFSDDQVLLKSTVC